MEGKPATGHIQIHPEATIEDLYRASGKAELVDGKVMLMAPTGRAPGYAGDEIFADAVVKVYRASDPEHPTIYRRGDIAEAEPSVPGWSMLVDNLFM